MEGKGKLRAAGVLAGAVNGAFGGGGGMVLLPLLERWSGLSGKTIYATSTGVILPLCAISAGIYALHGQLPLGEAWPYLAGGALGGAAGGWTFRWVPVKWLKGCFGAFLLYGGVRYLL